MSDTSGNLIRLRENLQQVQQRMASACLRGERDASTVRLVAVTKSVDMPVIQDLIQCGQCVLGENRPQQLIQRAAILESLTSHPETALQWHLIGQLQSNKIRSVLPRAAMIHSIDSVTLLNRISRIAKELGLVPRLLLQVNISGETSKSGFTPNALRDAWEEIQQIEHVELAGFMTMAPLTDEEQSIRQTFRGLRELRDELQCRADRIILKELSMGMSHDFEIAIEEGATLVRVGTSLFEGCEPS